MKSIRALLLASAVAVSVLATDRAGAQPGPGTGYPYVKTGSNIIVNRDEFGGVKKEKLFSSRSADKLEDKESAQAQAMLPAQFEVRFETDESPYTYSSAGQCADGWRMPTYREGLLVLLLNAELANPVESNGNFFTATYFELEYYRYCVADNYQLFPTSSLILKSTSTVKGRLCIRDIDTTSLGLSDL